VGQGSALGAADIGCVDTANAGIQLVGKPRKPHGPPLRALFHTTRAP
jgi:hypothetical protein